MAAAQALNSLLSLPRRAGEWRALRRERAAQAALREAQAMARQYSVPVVVEVILEKVTNISMGVEIDKFGTSTAAAIRGFETTGPIDFCRSEARGPRP